MPDIRPSAASSIPANGAASSSGMGSSFLRQALAVITKFPHFGAPHGLVAGSLR